MAPKDATSSTPGSGRSKPHSAAEATPSRSAVQSPVVADVVGRLVDRSLVVHSPTGQVSRFFLLEMVKAYAEGRLVESLGEAEDVRDRHLAHFHRPASDGRLVPFSHFRVAERLERDVSNLATVSSGQPRQVDGTKPPRLPTEVLKRFLLAQHIHEVRSLLEACLPHLNGGPHTRRLPPQRSCPDHDGARRLSRCGPLGARAHVVA